MGRAGLSRVLRADWKFQQAIVDTPGDLEPVVLLRSFLAPGANSSSEACIMHGLPYSVPLFETAETLHRFGTGTGARS